ncbi:MAG TPA: hydantoinase B/oxoprolinase family protein [Ramlibacter sp.]|nr:hydantoinase B/oxoprolinase family protein [Ramlibacter sp.]
MSSTQGRIGIDIGGTFTDFALETVQDGVASRHFAKVLTTPDAPERAVLEGLDQVLRTAGLAPSQLDAVLHGTTLATNAVIERRGARIAFITTEGFRDTLEMGTESRYDHYDLHVAKPAPIVPRHLRFTVPERMSATGQVLKPLPEEALAALLPALDRAEVQAVAIGFLHSYANPAHEQQAAAFLRRHRPQLAISTSADVAPEIREYERFATACVNAFVQPLMAGYLGRLQAALVERGITAPLYLMLSNGGLCEVALARRYPVRLLESGPAGGSILAASVATQLGADKALLVDIGGTTAKLCFIDDGMPQTARTMEVARLARFKAGSGIPLRFPVVELAEIGAGGGSIAHLDALGRLQVGPESAGSVPGPACYGRGGTQPTVTDAHLVLGRLDAASFAGGRMPLDLEAAQRALQPLGEALGLSVTDTAWSICELVDESMATAVHEHAVEVGKGVEGRTLIAIGGMAPLHAARLARKLGLERVVVPDGAGVGSALGFLRGPIAFESTRSVRMLLSQFDAAAANALLEPMAREMHAVVRRAAPQAALRETRTAWMRYQGQGYEIRVPLPAGELGAGDDAVIRRSFEDAYRALYGRLIEGATPEVLGWSVRAEAPPEPVRRLQGSGTAADDSIACRFFDQSRRQWADGQAASARRVAQQGRIAGPALLREEETTIVVPTGCEATGTPDDHLLLVQRESAAAQGDAMPQEIRAQVIWGRLIAVVEEQARTLMRTAFSATVREAGDLSAGLFDLQGRLVAQAVTGTPGHVNSMAACATHFLAKYPPETMREGDHYITNDPWLTSGHLHDVTVLSPAFQHGKVIGFFACTCHQVDVGGLGQGPDGRSVFEEGLCLPILPLARAGQVNQDLLEIVRVNVRQPDLVVGDMLSYITTNEVSGRRLAAMLDEFGEQGLEPIAAYLLERSAAGMRKAIAALPAGTYRSQLQLDGYDTPVHIECAVTIVDGRIRVSFDGSSPASSRGINLVLNYTRAYAAFGVRAAVAPDVPNNAGSLALVEVDAPAGSILNAQRPAPVCARHIIGQFLPEVVLGALAHAMPGRVPAEGAACNWGLQLRGGPAVATAAGAASCEVPPFEILFFNAGGSGARPGSDGLSATAFPSGIRAIPVEVCESAAPIVIWRKELLPGSGGTGRFRGGLGQRVEVATLDGSPFQVFGIFDRVRNPARGRDGGADGAPGWVGLASGQPLRSMGLQTVPAGEVLRIDVPGGGGLGPAAERVAPARHEDERLGYLAAGATTPIAS